MPPISAVRICSGTEKQQHHQKLSSFMLILQLHRKFLLSLMRYPRVSAENLLVFSFRKTK